jgi:hypothetical protein
MLGFGSHAGLAGVLALGSLNHTALVFGPARSEILRLRRSGMDDLGLA